MINLRLRNVKNKKELIDNSEYIIKNEKEYKGKWNEIFKNNNKIYIEIGSGKGDFLIENAKRYKDINFIGIEKYDSVIARFTEKLIDTYIPNLKLIRMDAKEIDEVFDKEIDKIYLNFSDPWPKKRHSKRRLTSTCFLEKYDKIFKDVKEIEMKTDNISLFEFSLEMLSNYGYVFKKVSLDLVNSDVLNNIMTEYEKKFVKNGIKINYLIAKKTV